MYRMMFVAQIGFALVPSLRLSAAGQPWQGVLSLRNPVQPVASEVDSYGAQDNEDARRGSDRGLQLTSVPRPLPRKKSTRPNQALVARVVGRCRCPQQRNEFDCEKEAGASAKTGRRPRSPRRRRRRRRSPPSTKPKQFRRLENSRRLTEAASPRSLSETKAAPGFTGVRPCPRSRSCSTSAPPTHHARYRETVKAGGTAALTDAERRADEAATRR
jgi:hypothetical protein